MQFPLKSVTLLLFMHAVSESRTVGAFPLRADVQTVAIYSPEGISSGSERTGNAMSKIYKDNYYESEELEEAMVLPITLDDGTQIDCEVLAIFPVKGLKEEHQYIAMLPLAEDMDDIFLYRFVPVGEEEFELEGIEDDDEYEAVVDVFDMLLDDAEFDLLADDEDEE